jgi:hypothetical protein
MPFNLDALDSGERAGSQQINSRKQRSADVPLKQVKVVVLTANGNQLTDRAVDNNRCHIGFDQQTLEKDHPKVWPPGLISILQKTMATPCRHRSKPIFKFDLDQLHQATSPQQLHQATSPRQLHQAMSPRQLHQATSPRQLHQAMSTKQPNSISYPKPSLAVWPPGLISILQQTMATPCRHPSKLIFKFNLSVKAAEKNYIILMRKFEGDLHKALHAQQGSPLQYGSEFKPVSTLAPIFSNCPSWEKMRTVLSDGSMWPLSPLNNQN